MTAVRFANGKMAILRGEIDFISTPISAALVDLSKYTLDVLGHLTLADLTAESILSITSVTNRSIEFETGTLFADDLIFINIAESSELEAGAIILFVDKSDYNDCVLILYNDEITDFPISPVGDDIVVHWPEEGILVI